MQKAIQYNQDIIAMIWDFDKTLIPDYSQKPLLEYYNIDEKEFWRECNEQKAAYEREGARVNADTYYLNHILSYVEAGVMAGLTLDKLMELGGRINLFPGLPDFFPDIKKQIETEYEPYEIKVEHYVVSTGMKELIKGSRIAEYVKDIWSCEFLQHKFDKSTGRLQKYETIVDIGYTLDNTSKTRAIFEINKGINVHAGLNVNQTMPEEDRRIPVSNMIYIADGPSDIPAFSVVKKGGGRTLAVFKEGDSLSFSQAKNMMDEQRVHYFSQADYTRNSPTYQWLFASVDEIAKSIVAIKKARLNRGRGGVPDHLVG